MNFNRLIFKTLFLAFLSVFSTSLSAQKEYDNFDIISLNLIQLDLKVENGNLVISNKTDMYFDLDFSVNNGKGATDSFVTTIIFHGRLKNTEKALEYKKRLDEAERIRPDSPFILTSVVVAISNKYGVISKDSLNISDNNNKKSSFAILLNGHAQPKKGVCSYGKCYCLSGYKPTGKVLDLGNTIVEQTLKIDKEKNSSLLTYSINFDKNSTEDNEILESLLTWGELSLSAEVSISDEKGDVKTITSNALYNQKISAHFISDQFSAGHTRTQRISAINLIFTNPSNDKFTLKQILFGGVPEGASNENYRKETWLIIQNIDDCKQIKLNRVFLNESNSGKHSAVVVGLNKNKEDKAVPLATALESVEVSGKGVFVWQIGTDKTTINNVAPSKDKNGNWTFSDSLPITDSKNPPLLVSFQIETVNTCNDSTVYYSEFKQKLKDKSNWDYQVQMSVIASENPLFQGANDAGTNILAAMLTGSSIAISGGNFEIRDNSKLTIGIGDLKIKKSNPTFGISSISISIRSGAKSIKQDATWNKTTEMFEATYSIEGSEKTPFVVNGVVITIVKTNKDTIIYESNGKFATSLDDKYLYILLDKSETIKYYNPCKTKYKLKEIEYSETKYSGTYSYMFWVKFEANSDAPNAIAMIVEVKDCKGNSEFVSVSFTFDSKTETYAGGFNLNANKDCALTLNYGEVAAYNTCNDKTVWSFDPSKAKGNGSGTKNASTTTSTRPQLL